MCLGTNSRRNSTLMAIKSITIKKHSLTSGRMVSCLIMHTLRLIAVEGIEIILKLSY